MSACMSMNYEPPAGGSDNTLAQQAAKCRIYARSGSTGVIAVGSPAFVGGALIGSAIGNAIRVSMNYKDCMLANGWTEARPQPKPVQVQPANPEGPVTQPSMVVRQ